MSTGSPSSTAKKSSLFSPPLEVKMHSLDTHSHHIHPSNNIQNPLVYHDDNEDVWPGSIQSSESQSPLIYSNPQHSSSGTMSHLLATHHPSLSNREYLSQPHSFAYHQGIWERLRPWYPFILWAMTSAGFLLAVTIWRTELFQGLEDLSHYLQKEGTRGQVIAFLCIFVTTFPPLPLYSTLIILSGYTFGPWVGFAISYCAALSGAVVVYLLSHRFLRDYLSDVLRQTGWVKRVVGAIERRPQLLFLIRVAPYPYNLLNALLAASPSLSFKTYFVCTALSLLKLIIHTTAGSTIHQFAEYHASEHKGEREGSLARTWTVIGITLCIGIFVYLSYLARKAVGEEEEEDVERGLSGEMTQVTRTRENSRI